LRTRFGKFSSPLAVGLLLLGAYLVTLAPGLTWANSGADGGDLITAAAVGGVPHPTGYPTYLLLARAFQLLPLHTLAYRTNLMSAVLTALTAALLCDFARRTQPTSLVHPGITGFITGLAYGLAPLVWSQAVITEVYALQSLSIVLALWCFLIPSRGRRVDFLFGLSLGLALGVHLTTLLFVPAFILARALRRNGQGKQHTPGASLLSQLGGMAVGLLVYVVLPLRAMGHPPVNWGGADTPAGLWWLVSGQLYHDNLSLGFTLGLFERLRSIAGLLLEQAGLPGLSLSALGLVWYFRPSGRVLLTTWMFVASTVFSLLYRTEDAYVYLIPAIISCSVWLGWGSAMLAEQLSRRWRSAVYVVGALVAVYLLGLAVWHRPQVDAARDDRAEQFAGEAMRTLPDRAIVLARGDGVVFALWYEVFALRQRADLAVLAEDLLPFDWYRQTLRDTYPGLVVPDQPDNVWEVVIQRENAGRPLCYVSTDDPAGIDCR
jgi:transmembrane protein TMEM260 (protein O-mannosyltransferase)